MGELLLAIDSSTRFASVALLDPSGRVEASRSTDPEEGAPLAGMVEAVMQDRWRDLGAYGIGIGPGSFTGLRVGLAFLKGLAAVTPRPVVPVSSLAAWAQSLDDASVDPREPRWVLLDARRDQAWVGCYQVDDAGLVHPARPDRRLPIDALEAQIEAGRGVAVGTLADRVRPWPGWTTASGVPGPSAAHLGRLAQRDWRKGRGVPIRSIAPNYLMLSAAEERVHDR